MEHIHKWALQDYQFRRAVPRIAMLRYLACTDPEIATKLYEVVEEETRGDTVPLRSATAAHLYYAELVIHTLPWFVMMSAQIGAEGTFPPAVSALGKGFISKYNMSPKSVRFFTVHAEADEEHGALAEEILIRYITSPHLQQQTREATLRRMELLYDVWTIDS
jgi:pyrroloquinoline quinone (PQQ) biosynthesis protein C